MQNVTLEVTVPSSSYYQIEVSRYRSSPSVIFLEPTTAYVKATTHTTEQVTVQRDRVVTTYPYKDYESVGIGVMLAGIGVGVFSVSNRDSQNNQESDTLKSSTIHPSPYQKNTSNSKFCIFCGAEIPLQAKFCDNCGKSA